MVTEDHYPSVDISFLKELIEECFQIESQSLIGKTTVYLVKGESPVHKRLIYLRNSDTNEVDYYYATGICIRFGKKGLSKLSKWFEDNKNWKDGGYVAPHLLS